jgi:hypothetical protein
MLARALHALGYDILVGREWLMGEGCEQAHLQERLPQETKTDASPHQPLSITSLISPASPSFAASRLIRPVRRHEGDTGDKPIMKTKNCVLCDGNGFYAVANGEEDAELVYCVCEAGKIAEFDDVLV